MDQVTAEQTEQVPDSVSAQSQIAPISDKNGNGDGKETPEVRDSRALAHRYRLPFVDLLPREGQSPIDYSLLGEIPVDLMVRNQFVPLRREGNRLHVAIADPTD